MDGEVPARGVDVQTVRHRAVVGVGASVKQRRVPKGPVGNVVLVKVEGLLLLLELLLLRADAVTSEGIGMLVVAYGRRVVVGMLWSTG